MEFFRKHKLITATIAIQIVALPLIVLLVNEQQDTRRLKSAHADNGEVNQLDNNLLLKE